MDRLRNAARRFAAAAAWTVTAVALSLMAWPAKAAQVRRLELGAAGLAAELKMVPRGAAVMVAGLPLFSGEAPATLELARFEVWKPGARVWVAGAEGLRAEVPPASARFRGTVAGEPESFVFLSATSAGLVRGLVNVRERVFVFRGGLVREVDARRDLAAAAAAWRCGVEDPALPAGLDLGGMDLGALDLGGPPPAGLLGGPSYAVDLAVDTDYEFYNLFDSVPATADYVADLVGAVSAIYERDVAAEIRVSDLFTYTAGAGSDPWTATSSSTAADEVRGYWTANRTGVSRTTVHFLSAKILGGGWAWVGVLCNAAFGYGVTGNLSGTFDPGSPTVIWDIYATSHEIGHNFASPHTHCYNTYPTAGSPPVDTCHSGETGCYSGGVSVPSGGGSIMSYCHLRSGGYSNINLYLGRAGFYGTQSERVTQRIGAHLASRTCLPEPANSMFEDGFDTGDTSAWSGVEP